MGTKDEIESAVIRCPRRGEGYAIAGTASTQVFAVPASWKGKKVRFEAWKDTFYVLTASDTSITVVPAQVQTIVSNVLTGTNTGVGERIAMDQYKEFDFTAEDAFVAFIGTGTTGTLYFREAETALGST